MRYLSYPRMTAWVNFFIFINLNLQLISSDTKRNNRLVWWAQMISLRVWETCNNESDQFQIGNTVLNHCSVRMCLHHIDRSNSYIKGTSYEYGHPIILRFTKIFQFSVKWVSLIICITHPPCIVLCTFNQVPNSKFTIIISITLSVNSSCLS